MNGEGTSFSEDFRKESIDNQRIALSKEEQKLTNSLTQKHVDPVGLHLRVDLMANSFQIQSFFFNDHRVSVFLNSEQLFQYCIFSVLNLINQLIEKHHNFIQWWFQHFPENDKELFLS